MLLVLTRYRNMHAHSPRQLELFHQLDILHTLARVWNLESVTVLRHVLVSVFFVNQLIESHGRYFLFLHEPFSYNLLVLKVLQHGLWITDHALSECRLTFAVLILADLTHTDVVFCVDHQRTCCCFIVVHIQWAFGRHLAIEPDAEMLLLNP